MFANCFLIGEPTKSLLRRDHLLPNIRSPGQCRSYATFEAAVIVVASAGTVRSIAPRFGTPTEPSVALSSVSGRLSVSVSLLATPAAPSVWLPAVSGVRAAARVPRSRANLEQGELDDQRMGA